MQRVAYSFHRWLDVFFRHRAANDAAFKFKALTRLVRLDFDDDVAVLAATAALANEPAFGFNFLANGFLICHLRFADARMYFEFAQQAVDQYLQMQLAHA